MKDRTSKTHHVPGTPSEDLKRELKETEAHHTLHCLAVGLGGSQKRIEGAFDILMTLTFSVLVEDLKRELKVGNIANFLQQKVLNKRISKEN